MKVKVILLIIVFNFNIKTLTAQIKFPGDSITTFLCHKWGFKAIIMGGQRLTNMNESITYDFVADGTFKRIPSNGKVENGTWTYKPGQKIIVLKIKKIKLHISSLSNNELIVSAGEQMDETKNSLGVGTVLQPID